MTALAGAPPGGGGQRTRRCGWMLLPVALISSTVATTSASPHGSTAQGIMGGTSPGGAEVRRIDVDSGLAVSRSDAGATPVDIPDANLRRAIERELGKDPGAAITRAEMVTLEFLNAGSAGVVELGGLEFATRLGFLSLHSNRIADLSPLAGLSRLKQLSLGNNDVADLRPLATLTELTFLDLDRNLISDLRPLSGLARLDRLLVRDNRVVDLQPLAGLGTLTRLFLDQNAIVSVAPLAGLRALAELSVSRNRVRSLAPLAGLTRLTGLDASYNQIEDARWAAHLTELERLDLSDNAVRDLGPLAGAKRLQTLHMRRNGIEDLGPLAELTALDWLWLGNNAISDVSALGGLTRLEQLELMHNPLSSVAPLAGLSGLRRLNLRATGTSDISALAGLTALTEVDLAENELRDVSALGALSELETLRLHAVGLADLSGLAGLRRLTYVALGDNRISDLTPVVGWAQLERLFLARNRVADLTPLTGLTELWQLDLDENRVRDLQPLVANPGIGDGARVSLFGNPLSGVSIGRHIPALRSRGVSVFFAEQPPVTVYLGLSVAAAPGGSGVFARNDLIRIEVRALQGEFRCTGTFDLRIDIGGRSRYASSGFGQHGPTVQLTYLVAPDDSDADGISIGTEALEFSEGICEDVRGHGIFTQLARGTLRDDGRYRVNGALDRAPGIERLEVSRPAVDDTFVAGEPIVVRMRFSEPIRVAGDPRVALRIGGQRRFARMRHRSRTGVSFVYRVSPGAEDTGGLDFGNAIAVEGGVIRDAAGNSADLGVPRGSRTTPYRVRGGLEDGAPTVSGLSMSAYRAGAPLDLDRGLRQKDRLQIRVDFTEYVELRDAATLELAVGSRRRQASLVEASGNGLRFEYLVDADDRDADGVTIGRLALQVPAGGLRDGAGNPARLDLGVHAVTGGAGPRVQGSTRDQPPTVEWAGFADLTPRRGNGGVGAGEPILFVVRFDEPVRVVSDGGMPVADVALGPERRSLGWADGVGSDRYRRHLVFDYVVGREDRLLGRAATDDGEAPARLDLQQARIVDRTGNAARLAVPGEGLARFWRIDGALPAPAVAAAEDNYFAYTSVSSDHGEDHSFGRHEIIDIPVRFTEPVAVRGTPDLPFRIGNEVRAASYVSGAGSRSLLFRYRVRAGDRGRVEVPATRIELGDAAIIGASGQAARLDVGGIASPDALGRQYFADGGRGPDAVVPPIAAPGNVRVDGGLGELSIMWDRLGADLSGGTEVTRYVAVARPEGGGAELSCTARAEASRCTIAGLPDDTPYSVHVFAVNALGRGYLSAAVTASTDTPRSFWRGWRLELGRRAGSVDEP